MKADIDRRLAMNLKKPLNNRKGSSLVELVMVMMLLMVFGFTIYSLIYAGSETQAAILENKDAQVDARIALSYVNVRLRQNDAAGKISIIPNPNTGQNAIVIKERDEWYFDTWIYWSNGRLIECITDPGEIPIDEWGFTIVEIEGFYTSLNPDGTITNTVRYLYQGRIAELSSLVSLRSCVVLY